MYVENERECGPMAGAGCQMKVEERMLAEKCEIPIL